MPVEKTCVHPFIVKTQSSFRAGSSLTDVLGKISSYQKKIRGLVTHTHQFRGENHPRSRNEHAGIIAACSIRIPTFKGA